MDYKLQEVTKIKLKKEEDKNHYYYEVKGNITFTCFQR